jgi:hypothetical protein
MSHFSAPDFLAMLDGSGKAGVGFSVANCSSDDPVKA